MSMWRRILAYLLVAVALVFFIVRISDAYTDYQMQQAIKARHSLPKTLPPHESPIPRDNIIRI